MLYQSILTRPFSVYSEMVGFGSGQGRSILETAGVAALRRGSQGRENAGRSRKMPLLDGFYLIIKLVVRLCQSFMPYFVVVFFIGHGHDSSERRAGCDD
jgi:hypothetical protein